MVYDLKECLTKVIHNNIKLLCNNSNTVYVQNITELTFLMYFEL